MKQNYCLDKERLVFVKVEKTIKQRLSVILNYGYYGFGLAIVLWAMAFYGLIELPNYKAQVEQNIALAEKVASVNVKFDSISNELASVQHRDDKLYRVVSQIEPISGSIRKAGFGGVKSYEHLEGFEHSELFIESNLKGDILQKQLALQAESYKKVANCVANLSDSILSIPAIMPISPEGYYRISSHFGFRIHPITKRREKHDGVDFAARAGRPVYASGNGVVSRVVHSNRGYGNMVMIDHGFGYVTRFAHLDEINVEKGDVLVRGEQLGTLGNTGRSTGPHLHYEVIHNKKRMNPADFYINDLTVEGYDNMITAFTK